MLAWLCLQLAACGAPDPGDLARFFQDGGLLSARTSVEATRISNADVVIATKPTGCNDPLGDVTELPFAVEERIERHAVSGATSDELAAALIARQRQRGAAPYIDWALDWRFDAVKCRTPLWQLALSVRYEIPEWKPPEEADAELVRSWDTFVAALWCHELGHTEIAVAAAEEALDALWAVGSKDSCAEIQAAAEEAFDAVMERHVAQERAYDAETGHGLTMGARFPPPP